MLAYMALQTSSEMHIWAPSMQFESIFMAGAVLLHRFPGVLLSMLLQTFAKSVGCLIALKHPTRWAVGSSVTVMVTAAAYYYILPSRWAAATVPTALARARHSRRVMPGTRGVL